jgi:F0F1-type ATP synthase membrane subunit b/b'
MSEPTATNAGTATRPQPPPDLHADPLAPLRAALLAAAHRDADAETAAADADRQRVLAEAQAEADRLLAQARAEGERDAEQLRREQRARSRRRARATVLAEQSRARDALRREVAVRLSALWDGKQTNGPIRERLVLAARAELGDDVVVHELAEGGIVATAGHARAVYRLSDLADQAIDSLDTELAGLWTP